MSIFECRCRCRYQCRDADAEVSKLPFTDLSGTTYFVELLNGYFLTFKDKDLLCLYEFFTIFTVVKMLAIFGTTWKLLNAILLWSCVGLLFWVFKDCLRIFVVFVKVDLCEIVLITSESTDYMSSLQLFYWVIQVMMWSANYCFEMHAFVWWRIRSTISGEEDFLKIEKIAIIMGKNALIVFIHGLNVRLLCPHLKCYFKNI